MNHLEFVELLLSAPRFRRRLTKLVKRGIFDRYRSLLVLTLSDLTLEDAELVLRAAANTCARIRHEERLSRLNSVMTARSSMRCISGGAA